MLCHVNFENMVKVSKKKELEASIEKEMDKQLKCMKSYRGGELIPIEFTNFCTEYGIKKQLFSLRIAQQIGIIERRN